MLKYVNKLYCKLKCGNKKNANYLFQHLIYVCHISGLCGKNVSSLEGQKNSGESMNVSNICWVVLVLLQITVNVWLLHWHQKVHLCPTITSVHPAEPLRTKILVKTQIWVAHNNLINPIQVTGSDWKQKTHSQCLFGHFGHFFIETII